MQAAAVSGGPHLRASISTQGSKPSMNQQRDCHKDIQLTVVNIQTYVALGGVYLCSIQTLVLATLEGLRVPP